MRHQRESAGGQKGSDESQRQHRRGDVAQPLPADIDAAVEQDDDQRHHGDALYRLDVNRIVERGPKIRCHRRGDG